MITSQLDATDNKLLFVMFVATRFNNLYVDRQDGQIVVLVFLPRDAL